MSNAETSAETSTKPNSEQVVEVRDLHKTFRIGFFRKRIDAVRGIDFEVKHGEIFGLLGPNGAGKTTTIKMLLRLIFPTSGSVRIFGRSNADRESMRRIGYMPENPYVYQYLKPLEFLDLCGRLVGMDAATRRKRSAELIERIGLGHAVDRPVGRFSKGMTQRIGLAQALLHDPEVLILDEPMSGLDPVGRKEIREILFEQRQRGKTLIFTSHILSDVETLCDRVTIISRGKVMAAGALSDLLRPEVRQVEFEFESVDDALRNAIRELGATIRDEKKSVHVVVEGDQAVPRVLELVQAGHAKLLAMTPKRETLEDLFVRNAVQQRSEDAARPR
ncbi:MAG: ABC transporter ATP-binding protein [Polyangiales bacterium]|nr:ABC transporter ATP-binding protein [Myxococcales bacterium]